MPDLFPFRGLRYRHGPDVSAVVAPPYDVIDEDEHAALERSDRHNAVRLILPRAENGLGPYESAAATLAAWQADATLALDDEPGLYSYRMAWTGPDGAARSTQGVIGALALPDQPGGGDVLPHERTLPKARSDRLALLRATRANLDPIWGLSLASGLSAGIESAEHLMTAVDATGTRHDLGRLPPARITELQQLIASAAIVLADGHHRFETACTYRDESRPDGPPESPPDRPVDAGATAIMTFVVEAAEEQLVVAPIHRLVTGASDLRERIVDAFEVEPITHGGSHAVAELVARMDAEGVLGLLDAHGAALLRPLDGGPASRMDDQPEVLRDVDSVRFDLGVRPHLGDATLGYRADATTVSALVEHGTVDAAVLLRPVSVAQIRSAAHAGVRMPEKTTFFTPKPRTGMVFRLLDH